MQNEHEKTSIYKFEPVPMDREGLLRFVRRRTGKTLPRWEASLMAFIERDVHLNGPLAQTNLFDPRNFPKILKAFNDAVALDEASGSVHVLAVSRIAARVAKTEDDYQGGNAEWYSYGIAP
jgi:hypothetical protein